MCEQMQSRIICLFCRDCWNLISNNHVFPRLQLAKKRFHKRTIYTKRCTCIMFPSQEFACQCGNATFLAEGTAVSCIQIAFGQHTIYLNNEMLLCFHMIIIIRSNGFIVENRETIHQHTCRHKLAIKEQAMLGSNQHVLVRNTVRNSIFENTYRITSFVILQMRANNNMRLTCPGNSRGLSNALHIGKNRITHADIFDRNIASRCLDHAACKKTYFSGSATIIVVYKGKTVI
ncbi:hypothetical protein SRCM100623_00615 [Acetobacter pasteurianus]|uniref:Uncharacterized protein n=1 Tax=Acetobacter pasteurianus TaxID=438 RepID=A0A1A0DGT1_ACEPA|nr:hypothetical protein SRCM100623_00615 [Acetobacter pasteurianus]